MEDIEFAVGVETRVERGILNRLPLRLQNTFIAFGMLGNKKYATKINRATPWFPCRSPFWVSLSFIFSFEMSVQITSQLQFVLLSSIDV